MGDLEPIWLVMARTGGDYEYCDGPLVWRPSQEHAEAVVRDFAKRIAELKASVPPCPAVEDSDKRWSFYERREKRAREAAVDEIGVGLDATFFALRVDYDPTPTIEPITGDVVSGEKR
jgi:hypothetical protein